MITEKCNALHHINNTNQSYYYTYCNVNDKFHVKLDSLVLDSELAFKIELGSFITFIIIIFFSIYGIYKYR